MRTLRIQELTLEKFAPYGTFASMTDPQGPTTGIPGGVIEFYRDMAVVTTPGDNVGLSVTKVRKRPLIVVKAEYHDHCGEAMVPLDDDVIIFVAPATPHGVIRYEDFEAFRVPRGTLIVIRPGVWHHAPFCANADSACTLVVLPERTYANDCAVTIFPEEDQIRLQ